MKNIQNAESKILPWVRISILLILRSKYLVGERFPQTLLSRKRDAHDQSHVRPVYVVLSYRKLPWGVLFLRLLGFVSVEKEMVLYIVYKNACGKI